MLGSLGRYRGQLHTYYTQGDPLYKSRFNHFFLSCFSSLFEDGIIIYGNPEHCRGLKCTGRPLGRGLGPGGHRQAGQVGAANIERKVTPWLGVGMRNPEVLLLPLLRDLSLFPTIRNTSISTLNILHLKLVMTK